MRAELADALGDQLDVRLADGRVVVARDQDPLAADGEVGGEPGAQRGIRHLSAEVAARDPLDTPHEPRIDGEAEDVTFAAEIDEIGRAHV